MPSNYINQFPSIHEMTNQLNQNKKVTTNKIQIQGSSFEQILDQKRLEADKLKLSKHATGRLQDRNIEMSQEQWKRLEDGVAKAGEKGIRESLVMVDQFAFIVNVDNNTVVTAVGAGDDKVFTNIDGAVIA